MADDAILLDTSLLVAASVKMHPSHQTARAFLTRLKADETPTCITPQVCREFLVVLTRQPVSGVTFTVEEAVNALAEWKTVSTLLEEDGGVIAELLRLIDERQVRGKQIHDCNLVATMIAHGVGRLATRNATDFKRYESEIDVAPLDS